MASHLLTRQKLLDQRISVDPIASHRRNTHPTSAHPKTTEEIIIGAEHSMTSNVFHRAYQCARASSITTRHGEVD
jgi:hypothetical protein